MSSASDPNATAIDRKREADLDFALTTLCGNKAVTPTGEPIDIGSEWGDGKKDTIAFYFSAHWCPPCRKFTPKLAKAYREYREKNADDKFELVFVSSDSDEDAFKAYHSEMTFPALDFSESRGDIKKNLSEKFNVQGIPSLAVMDAKTGERFDLFVDDDDDDDDDQKTSEKVSPESKWSMSPRDMVDLFGVDAFPLSKQSCDKCDELGNQEQLQALEQILPLTNVILPPKKSGESDSTDAYTFAEILEAYKYVGIMLGSKSALEMLPSITKVMNEVNTENSKTLAVVYVPGCFTEWDEYVDKPYKEENILSLFHFQETSSADTIKLMKSTAGKAKYDTLVVVQQTSKQVEECGMDGKCTSREVKGVELLATDEFASNCVRHGASYVPWGKAQVDQAEAAEKALAQETKAKMEASLESFLMEQAAEGNVQIGETNDAAAIADRLKGLDDEEGLIALLYHARPSLLPKLLESFEGINSTLTEGGNKKLEVVYVGPRITDQTDFDEDYAKMVTETSKTQFMAIACSELLLRRSMHGAFIQQRYDPTCIILMRKDGTLVSAKDDTADAIIGTGQWGFPWNEDGIARGEEKMKALIKEEDEKCEKLQMQMGVPVIRRMIGSGKGVKHIAEERIIRPTNCSFLTYGTQDALVTADTESNYDACSDRGVFYYEIEILKLEKWAHATQFGFAVPGALDEFIKEGGGGGSGCGDAKDSWGVCGLRGELWAENKSSPWFDAKETKKSSMFSTWKDGDVVGLAVNVNAGKIAVSVNEGDFAVVFQDDTGSMKTKGVFSCFSFDDDVEIRVNTTRATFKHDGPSSEVWLRNKLEPEAAKDE